jgi:serine protease Do
MILAGRGSELGISVRDVAEADAKREKLPSTEGAVIESIRNESPAAMAGLKAGDVVLEFDKERVRSARQLSRLVLETPAGRTVPVVVVRAGARSTISVAPVEASAGSLERAIPDIARNLPRFELPDFEARLPFRPGRLGVETMELNDQLTGYFGVKDGVLITSVASDTAAGRAGLRAGDVITTVNGTDIGATQDLRREMAKVSEGDLSLNVTRDRKPMTIKVTLERETTRTRRTA